MMKAMKGNSNASGRSGLLGVGVLGLFLVAFPLTASATAANDPWITETYNNRAYVSDGRVGKITSIYKHMDNPYEAEARVRVKDKFGNWFSRNVRLRAAATKVTQYGLLCVRNPVACAAAAGITAALAAAGIEYVNDQFIQTSTQGDYDLDSCTQVYHEFENSDGTITRYRAPIPCVDQRYSSKWTIYSPQNDPNLHEWSTHVTTLEDFYSPVISTSPDYKPTYGLIYVYTRSFSATVPQTMPEADAAPASAKDVADAIMPDPALWSSDGMFPDIWGEISPETIGEPLPDEIEDKPPEPDDPSAGDGWASMDEVPNETVDVSSYLDWGSSWLPSQCPADYQSDINVLGNVRTLKLEWKPICDATTTYVNPLLRVAGLLAFMGIVFRGKQGE